jgi:tetrahydromethanopterin S-methyltransferase subunit G
MSSSKLEKEIFQGKLTEMLQSSRNQLTELYRSGRTNIKMLMKHLNPQVYQALDFQVQRTLATMENNVEEKQISHWDNRLKLVLEPPLATVSMKLYSQIGKLVGIPAGFFYHMQVGIILLYHMQVIDALYKRTELLIHRIFNCCEQFHPWIVLGQIPDSDQSLQAHLTEQANW